MTYLPKWVIPLNPDMIYLNNGLTQHDWFDPLFDKLKKKKKGFEPLLAAYQIPFQVGMPTLAKEMMTLGWGEKREELLTHLYPSY
jgi:hypothetical protein